LKLLLKLIALLSLLAFGLHLAGCSDDEARGKNAATQPPEGVPVETATAQQQDLAEMIDSVGSLEPLEEVEIRPEIAGIIQTIHFQEGQGVTGGDLLFTLDDARLQQRLHAREAALAGAAVEKRNAERVYRRRQELFEERVIAREARDNARTEYEAARARVERLSAEIREIQEKLQDTRIRSPISGRTGELLVDRGDFVSVGDLLVTVVRLDRLKISFTIPERYLGRLHTEQRVKITVAAYPEKTYRGEVYFISPRIQKSTRDLTVKALLDNAAGELRPGAFASVKLIVGERPGALVVPEEALIPTQTGYGVFVVNDSTAAWRPVTIGLRRPGRVEIRRGLKAGEVVIRTGHISVSDGARVRVVGNS
jgi:membrane fusion protein (multidrug efflux system)